MQPTMAMAIDEPVKATRLCLSQRLLLAGAMGNFWVE